MDMVQNPNFSSLMRNQDYFNTLAQLVADRQARGEMPGLMPIGGTGISAEQMQNLSPERRMALDGRMAMQPRTPTLEELRASRKILAPMPPLEQGTVGAMPPTQERSKELEIFNKLRRGEQLTPEEQLIDINLQRKVPAPTPPPEARPQAPQMPQMQNYNQMLQQGMRRNQDMNQAAQNLAAPAGPARSFSQVAGRTRRTPMPRPPVNNSLTPSNRRLI
jgi:hypothetical protein